jgi:hypothetical protein
MQLARLTLRQPEWPFDGLFYVNRVVDGCFVIDMILQFNLVGLCTSCECS